MKEEFFESLEKNLGRLSEIQQETDQIIRTYQDWEKEQTIEGVDHTQNGQTAALSRSLQPVSTTFSTNQRDMAL